ncbi:MAG: TauD/TfdA family dioxygenase [Rhodospirillales bacterium]
MSISIHPLNAVLGAEVEGLDLRNPLSADTASALRNAWLKYKVLLIRDQDLTCEQQIAFSKNFGELEAPVMTLLKYKEGSGQKTEIPPEITVVSNVKENGKPIGQLGNGEAFWHSDSNFIEDPPSGGILHAKEIPPAGGNTAFLDTAALLAALPESLREKIKTLSCKHDPSLSSTGTLRKDFEPLTDVSKNRGPAHPLIVTHPETNEKSLFLGRRLNAYIADLDVAESDSLLDELWEYTQGNRFVYEHTWRVGDLLIWDNRAVLHRRDSFDDSHRRVMHKTVLKGTRPH